MRAQFLSPLLRSSVGFDRVDRLLDTVSRMDEASLTYPPYNIEKTGEDDYRITMAVAGFDDSELDVTQQENVLLIRGKAHDEESGKTYLHRGIARRAFERRFELADTVRVTGASLSNGLLSVELVREIPEARKPRKIEIGEEVRNSDVPVVVDFWAEWCGPCKQIGPILEELSDEMAGKVKVAKVDVDANQNAAMSMGVRGIPALFIFKDGEVISNRAGAAPKAALQKWIEDSI